MEAAIIALDGTDSLEREDSLTSIVWVREINPLKTYVSRHIFHQ